MSRDLSKKYPPKMLRLIIKELLKEMGEEIFYNPYEYNISNQIEAVLIRFGITNIESEDFGFWSLLVRLNKDKGPHQELQIPTLKHFRVLIEQRVVRYATEIYAHDIASYDESYVKSQIYDDPNFSPYNGDYIDTEHSDSDSGDWDISDITLEESQKKRKTINENSNSKNREILRLKKMKTIIEERLRLLSF